MQAVTLLSLDSCCTGQAAGPGAHVVLKIRLVLRRSLLYVGPGREDDTSWDQRTGGVEGPVLAALRPLSANAVRSKVPWLFSLAS